MKKRNSIIVSIFVVLVLCLGTFFIINNRDANYDNPPIGEPSIPSENHNPIVKPNEEIDKKIEEIMSEMTIDQKIAQMLVLYYIDSEVTDSLKETLQTINPGGFILMNYNITTYNKTKKFVEDLQQNSKIPMIIATDQEGGSVQRLQSLTDIIPPYIPYMYDLGRTNDEELAYNTGKMMAEQLRTIGVNVVFAPVVDIYSNPNNTVIGRRSFGTTAEQVSRMALSLAKGLEDNGVIATYKHFPGHGDTATDSHISLPVISKTYEELKETDLVPFVNAIESGAKIIMVGHLSLSEVTGDNIPSSLSKKLITDILINDLNYDGLIITDGLNMGALTNEYSYEEIYTMAIEAGVDLLLMPNGSAKTIEYVKKNVSEERIDQSVRKILKFKLTYLDNYEWLDSSYLNKSEHQEIIDKINER